MLNGLLEMLGGGGLGGIGGVAGGMAQNAGGMMNDLKPSLITNELYGPPMPPGMQPQQPAQPAMMGSQPYGPPMPTYDQALQMGRMQQPQPNQGLQAGMDTRQKMIMEMLQQGMGRQGQGQGMQVGPASIPAGMGPMQGRGGATATQGLMQSLQPQPGAFMRRPLGMGRY